MSVLEDQITIVDGGNTAHEKPARPGADCWMHEWDARRPQPTPNEEDCGTAFVIHESPLGKGRLTKSWH
jgi:hypothetical protein